MVQPGHVRLDHPRRGLQQRDTVGLNVLNPRQKQPRRDPLKPLIHRLGKARPEDDRRQRIGPRPRTRGRINTRPRALEHRRLGRQAR
jgi:hypothetical protein